MPDEIDTLPCPKCGKPSVVDRVAAANKLKYVYHCSSGDHTVWGPDCDTAKAAAIGWNDMVRGMPDAPDWNRINAGRIFSQCEEDLNVLGYEIRDSHESSEPVGIFKIEDGS